MQLDTALSHRRPLAGFAAGLGHAVARAANGFLNSLTTLAETSGRIRRIEALQAKSDADLAKMGLKRADIVHYVFRDQLI